MLFLAHQDHALENLVAGSTGIVKITDFGVSGELEDDIEQKNKVTFAAGTEGQLRRANF